ncbi:hypothetical protein NLI96_g9022 [Meripilus lineatus]|uniref:Enoyl reductase (ER) domain-containing protein n=1 Tax=Meripilus lineatus TaxID=2056292 RepID=A0AAD5V0X3_9APHY|nr:hypothetical protein NLI96_g9022 [Physisporinus lineatus]
MASLPSHTQAVTVQKSRSTSATYANDALLEEKRIQPLNEGQVLVKINAAWLIAGFLNLQLWIRKAQYPGIVQGSIFGADGAGIVVASSERNDALLNKRVFLVPMRGWESDSRAPESSFTIIGGGGAMAPLGTFAQYVAVERDQVIQSPDHLSDEEISVFPVGGVTAWRAVVVNAQVKKGDNVLITGIGGGVALVALQICLALGANVYVTSGHEDKIRKAVELGAKGGVNYKADNWPSQLEAKLKEAGGGKKGDDILLTSVIDSGGGDIMGKVGRTLRKGGKVVVYGMTANPKITFTMREVLKNQQLLGSTMGSHKDLIDATQFLAEHRIVPIISHTLDGLESVEDGFQLLEGGSHFGKVVIRIRHRSDTHAARL